MDALQLLKHLKLKIKISESMIENDTLILNVTSSILGRFISDGIEIENCSSLKYAAVTNLLSDINYLYVLKLLKHLKLKIKISERLIDGVNEGESSILGRFLKDGIEIENFNSKCKSF